MPKDEVVIRLSQGEFFTLLLMMGFATSAAYEKDRALAYSFIRLANAVNRDNPDWIPYEVPEDK